MTNLNIIFEDDFILIVNKPTGLVVNQSATIKEETLQDQLAKYFHLGSNLGIGERAGIVHRLDRETSGLSIVAKTQKAFDSLQKQFKERSVQKVYQGLVHGFIRDNQGSIESPITRIGKFGKFGVVDQNHLRGVKSFHLGGVLGREARTDFRVINYYQFSTLRQGFDDEPFGSELRAELLSRIAQGANDNGGLSKHRINYLKHHATDYTLLSLFPKTGRTHQIRVHLKSIGNPVVSDAIYTPHKLLKFDLTWCPRLFLHASTIEFIHPQTKKQVHFTCDLPKDLKNAILKLEIRN